MKNNNVFQQRENNKLTIFYNADNIDKKEYISECI